MFAKRILLLLILIAGIASAYTAQQFWKRYIDPRKSMKHFFLYIIANLTTVFVFTFLFGLLIFQFKDFFFKR
jgi:hypothetical protein